MLIDLNHNRSCTTVVALRPIFAIGNCTFDIRHNDHPLNNLPVVKGSYAYFSLLDSTRNIACDHRSGSAGSPHLIIHSS